MSRRNRWMGLGLVLGALVVLAAPGAAEAGHGCGRGHKAYVAGCGGCSPAPAAPVACGPAPVMVPQYETTYQTVVQTVYDRVPVTTMQTRYRTEYKTEQVPVTRTVFDRVTEPRTVTCYVPTRETVPQTITRMVCTPEQRIAKISQPYQEMQTIQTKIYRPKCETVMVPRVVTRYVQQVVQEQVPVTCARQVVEEQGCYQTVAVAPQGHCGHGRRLGHCGPCGSASTGCGVAPVCQTVYVSRPVCRTVYETSYKTVCKTISTPVQETIQVAQTKTTFDTEIVPRTICVTKFRQIDVPTTVMVSKPVSETVMVTRCVMKPQQSTQMVTVCKPRQVTETITRQVPVCVPEQVPVTTMTCQPRQVTHQVPVTRCVMVPAVAEAAPVASPASAQAPSPQG